MSAHPLLYGPRGEPQLPRVAPLDAGEDHSSGRPPKDDTHKDPDPYKVPIVEGPYGELLGVWNPSGYWTCLYEDRIIARVATRLAALRLLAEFPNRLKQMEEERAIQRDRLSSYFFEKRRHL